MVGALEDDAGEGVFADEADEGEDEDDGEDGQGGRQHDEPEGLPGRGAVDHRGFLERDRQGIEVALDHPDVGGDAAEVGEDQAGMGVESERGDPAAEGFEDGIDGDEGEDHREHLEDEEAAEDPFAAPEAHPSEGVGAGGGQREDQEGADGGHLDGVPEPAQDGDGRRLPRAVGLRHGQAEHHAPVFEAEGFGRGQDAADGEVALAERNGHDHEQGDRHEGDEGDQRGVREGEAEAVGAAGDHGRPPCAAGAGRLKRNCCQASRATTKNSSVATAEAKPKRAEESLKAMRKT